MHTRVWPVSFIWNAWNESIRMRVETYVPHFHVAVVLFPKTCDWKQNISLFVREVALFIPCSVSPAPVNIRGVRIWGRPGPGSPVPCLTRTRRARLWLADAAQLGLWLVSVARPHRPWVSSLGPVRARGTNPDDWLSRVSLQMHLQSAAVKTGTGAAVEQVADCSDSGERSWAACRVCRPI